MDAIETLLIERACERVIVDSASYNDERQWAALAGVYTPAGVVVRPNGQRIEGREAIEAAYAAGPPDRVTRHMCTNVRVEVDGPDHAHATTTVLIAATTTSADADVTYRVGEFIDRFERTDEGWKIAERLTAFMSGFRPAT